MAPLHTVAQIDRVERCGGSDFCTGRLQGTDVVLARTGVGKLYAAMAAQMAIERYHPDLVLMSGVAAALNGSLEVGDVVIARWVRDGDDGYHAAGQFVPGGFRLYGPEGHIYRVRALLTDERVFAAAQAAAPAIARLDGSAARLLNGGILTISQFLRCSARRQMLRELCAADALEMEGAGVAQVCAAHGVPFALIRAISDSGDDSLVNDPFTTMPVHFFPDQRSIAGQTPPPNPSNPGAQRSAAFRHAFQNAARVTEAVVGAINRIASDRSDTRPA